MSLARVKNFVAGEVLTATDLNAEFTNILTNALSLVSPLGADLAAGGFKVTGLAAGFATGDAVRYEQNLPATQTEIEAGANLTQPVVSGRQQYHPSACKGWGNCDFAGASSASYNLASVTDVGTGYQRYNWTVAFGTFQYAALASADGGVTALSCRVINQLSTGYVELITYNVAGGAAVDGTNTCMAVFGDQA